MRTLPTLLVPPRPRAARTLLLAVPIALALACHAVEHRDAPGALGPYSGSVRAGETIHVAGKVGAAGGTFAQEAQSAIDRVEEELRRWELSLADVVAVTVYVTDVARYEELNAIYAARFPRPYPARTFVAVAALPGERRIEITATAHRAGAAR